MKASINLVRVRVVSFCIKWSLFMPVLCAGAVVGQIRRSRT